MKKLYRLHIDCGRMGDVTGVFVADATKMAAAIGKQVYFGEILGKHSEICGTLGADEVVELTDDQAFIAQFEVYLPRGSGYNPLHYLSES